MKLVKNNEEKTGNGGTDNKGGKQKKTIFYTGVKTKRISNKDDI
jgi:hypothetical protein